MFKKNYYSCNQHPLRSYCYACKKFDNLYDADFNSRKTIINSTSNLNVQNIAVCENLPEFLVPFYLRYKLLQSNFTFRLKID